MVDSNNFLRSGRCCGQKPLRHELGRHLLLEHDLAVDERREVAEHLHEDAPVPVDARHRLALLGGTHAVVREAQGDELRVDAEGFADLGDFVDLVAQEPELISERDQRVADLRRGGGGALVVGDGG